ncbi:ribonuclease Z [Clostridium sp. SYSU_GA19001]|uniref:ribonuclease Z n=1 Tax=Clostridium caldaquaticum TaxID=2940653 RepID=UPI0020773D66|nr:ribonuclease Z [Clostridium caldaquaticum]MCM8711117.1 ribonuclease Z [Clostridium caldaquaticum]
MLNIALLGCGGSMPIPDRYLTSMLASYNGKMILIDCGEGTQVSLKLLKWGFKYIDIICFTHYHADHVVGFSGLLLTIANSGREEPLTVIGPPGLKEVVEGLTVIAQNLPYELKLMEISDKEINSFKFQGFTINTLPVEHTLPCLAYSIEVERIRKFDRIKAESENIPIKFWNRLRNGETINYNGRVLTKDLVLGEARKGIKVSYCTDSRPVEQLIDFIKEADLFICEGMYGDDKYLPKAVLYKHMLFSEGANLAKKGKVKELWLTHYSPSLINPYEYIDKTREIFKETILGEDRMTKVLNFCD